MEKGKWFQGNHGVMRNKYSFFLTAAILMAAGTDVQASEQENSGALTQAQVQSGYVACLREKILPEYGYADLEEKRIVSTSDSAMYQKGWDMRSGVFGAEMADLDRDGINELLVYDRGPDLENGYIDANGYYGGAMFLSVYETDGDGKVSLLKRLQVGFADRYIEYHTVRIGLMEVKDQVCVYVEEDSTPYFANGSDLSYTWYGFNESGVFGPLWMVGKTDGGSSGIAYSLLDYTAGGEPEKTVLWADGEFRHDYPDQSVYGAEGISEAEALEIGFHMLEIRKETRIESGGIINPMPSLWESIHRSVEYLCMGTRNSSEVELVSEGADYTGIRNVISCDIVGQGIQEASGGTVQNSTASQEPYTLDGSLFADGRSRTSSSGYILPDSGSKYLQESDIAQLSLKGLCYAKNEIYARHHRKFLSAELTSYFNSQPWYTGTIEPQDFTESVLNQTFNDYEKKNCVFLGNAEERRGTYALDQ